MLTAENEKDRNLVLQLMGRGVPVFEDSAYRLILIAILTDGICELVKTRNPIKINKFLQNVDNPSIRSAMATWFCERAPLKYDADRRSLKKKKSERGWNRVSEENFDDLENLFVAAKSTVLTETNADEIDLGRRVMGTKDFVSVVADELVLKRDLFAAEDLIYLADVIERVKNRKSVNLNTKGQ